MKAFIIAIILLTGSSVRGQIQFSSLEDVFRYADSHSIAIQSAHIQEQIFLSQEREARQALLPGINGSAGMTNNITLQPTLVPAQLFNPSAPEATYEEFTFGKKYLYNSGVQVNWDVLNFQKWFAVRTASAQTGFGKANTDQIRFDTYQALAGTYYSILLSEQYREIYQYHLETSRDILSHAEEKYLAGIISIEARNQARIQLLKAENELRDLETSLQQLYTQFQSQLGVDEDILITEAITTSGDALTTLNATSPHPEVAVQEAQLDLMQAQLKQAKYLLYPSISIGYQYNYTWATDQFLDFSNVNNLPQQSLGVKLNIPIFNGGASKGKIARAGLSVIQQEHLLENTIQATRREDEMLQRQYIRALAALQEKQEILDLQMENDQHSENKYQSGLISLDERLDKYQDLLTVQNQYLQSLSDYYVNYYQLYIRQIQ
ncbi:MAG: TolC family protein [Saprospiraceae bacterium]|nr:TolC family protein [Lewinella sp.]